MKLFFKIILGMIAAFCLVVILFLIYEKYFGPNSKPNWYIEKNAVPTATHPLAGFYKEPDCNDAWGIAIGPANEKEYYISFCGPGGCFAEDTYRPNSTIYNDANYEVVDENTIKLKIKDGWDTNVRCPSRN